jgi:hypothetical protein
MINCNSLQTGKQSEWCSRVVSQLSFSASVSSRKVPQHVIGGLSLSATTWDNAEVLLSRLAQQSAKNFLIGLRVPEVKIPKLQGKPSECLVA